MKKISKIDVRVTKEEKERVAKLAYKNNTTIAEILRRLIEKASEKDVELIFNQVAIKNRFSDLLADEINEINRMGNNINQIAKVLNSIPTDKIPKEAIHAMQKIDSIENAISEINARYIYMINEFNN